MLYIHKEIGRCIYTGNRTGHKNTCVFDIRICGRTKFYLPLIYFLPRPALIPPAGIFSSGLFIHALLLSLYKIKNGWTWSGSNFF